MNDEQAAYYACVTDWLHVYYDSVTTGTSSPGIHPEATASGAAVITGKKPPPASASASFS
jgi:hypothetical protein